MDLPVDGQRGAVGSDQAAGVGQPAVGASVRSGKLPATRWTPSRAAVADAQVMVGPSSGSAPARRTSGVPATEKYSGRTTRAAPAAAASSTRSPAAARLAVPVVPGRRLDGGDAHVTG